MYPIISITKSLLNAAVIIAIVNTTYDLCGVAIVKPFH